MFNTLLLIFIPILVPYRLLDFYSLNIINIFLAHKHKNYHTCLFAYALVVIEGLKAVNAPFQKLINDSLLSNFSLKNPNRYIPVFTIYNFFSVVSRYFDSKGYPDRFFKHLKFSNLGNLGKYICSSPRLISSLQRIEKYDQYFCNNQISQFSIDGSTVTITNTLIDSSSNSGAFMQSIWLNMMTNLLIQSSKELSSSIEIQLPSKKIKSFEHPLIKRSIKLNQNYIAVNFKSSLIANAFNCKNNSSKDDLFNKVQLLRPPISLSLKLEHFIETNRSEYFPTLPEIADSFGVAPSTLKRKLKEENTTYRDITESWRFTTAVSLLTHSSYGVNIISNQLYYSNSANFIRAFKRWSGQSPMKFRKTS